ncbi:MAG: PAS domain S-box protein [Candidatus Cyclobacteriaceae bacterium M2_1C_046]
MTQQKYTLLLVEDDEDDISLFKEHLEDSHLNAKLICVEKEEDFRREVESKSINAIICDYNLPGFNAMAALEIANNQKPEVPFILVSGMITQEIASEALKTGAKDVIEKGDYYRLIPAIERELNVLNLRSTKKVIEKKIYKKDAILQLIAENIDEVIGMASTEARIIYLSPGIKKITGKDVSEFIGKKIYDFIDAKDAERIRSTIKHDLSKNIPRTYKINLNFLTPDGGDRIILETLIKPIVSDARITKYALVLKDKTAELKNQEELAKTEKKFKTLSEELYRIFHESDSPFYSLSLDSTVEDWNKCAEELTGYSKEEILGLDFLDVLVPPEDHLSLINVFKEELIKGNSVNHEVPIITKKGDRRIWLVNATPRKNFKDETIGALNHGQDITELVEYRESLEKKVEERTQLLEESLEKERESSALKMRFISMASHEFRTPLSTMKFASSFLRRYQKKATEQQINERLDKIDEQVNNMVYLLDDVLSIGNNEAAKININLKEIDLDHFTSSVKNDVEQQYNTHEIIIEKEGFPKMIVSDRLLLNNIFINLLTNALKYSPGANKAIWRFQTSENMLIITVEDFGIGLDDEEITKVFEPFYRASNAGKIAGTGLGLAIVKKSVESLNGKVTLTSKKNKGTKFIISLPINEAKKDPVS